MVLSAGKSHPIVLSALRGKSREQVAVDRLDPAVESVEEKQRALASWSSSVSLQLDCCLPQTAILLRYTSVAWS
jgi:hypothetical protein